MRTYMIYNTESGEGAAPLEAASADEALEAYARRGGWRDLADAGGAGNLRAVPADTTAEQGIVTYGLVLWRGGCDRSRYGGWSILPSEGHLKHGAGWDAILPLINGDAVWDDATGAWTGPTQADYDAAESIGRSWVRRSNAVGEA